MSELAQEWLKLIIAILSLLYFIIQLCLIKPWRNSILSKAGECVLKTSKVNISKIIITLILCPLLIIFSLITKSTTFICCLMSLVADLCCYINAKELTFGKVNGVYKNGFIGAGRFISFDSIQSFPDTSWKEPEKQNTISLAIQLKDVKSKKVPVIFIDYESIVEYCKVINAIKELNQNK